MRSASGTNDDHSLIRCYMSTRAAASCNFNVPFNIASYIGSLFVARRTAEYTKWIGTRMRAA